MPRDDIIKCLKENQDRLRVLGVSHLALFGSVARNDAGPDSDVDVIVDAEGGVALGLFRLARISDELESLLRRPVDVISRRGLENTVYLKGRVAPDLVDVF